MFAHLAPLGVLFDIRFTPLLFVVAPQAYVVYLWLWTGSNGSVAAFTFAVAGAVGYESVYVGAIAWANHAQRSKWSDVTAYTALLFSVAVAVYVYRDQGVYAWLHAGFPLVGFAYTMTIHALQAGDFNAQPVRADTRADTHDVRPNEQGARDARDANETALDVYERSKSYALVRERFNLPTNGAARARVSRERSKRGGAA